MRVNYLPILAQIFGLIAALAVSLWGGRFLFLYLKNIKQVEKVRHIEANIAVLRMLLKTKIRKHINSIEGQFQGDKVFLALIHPHFEAACRIDFTRTSDYQTLIRTLCGAFQIIDTELQKRAPSFYKDNSEKGLALSEADMLIRLFPKYAGTLMNLIRDIVTTTAQLKTVIESYQENGKIKNKFTVPEVISIDDFEKLCEKANQQQTVLELEKLKAS